MNVRLFCSVKVRAAGGEETESAAQFLSLASVFSNGYIKELDLIAYEREDVDRLLKFMYQGE